VEGVPLLALAWATRGYPVKPGKKKVTHTFVCTRGTTAPGPDHTKIRRRVVDGVQVEQEFKVKRPRLVFEYFETAKVIDVHNHLRQAGLGMERGVLTKSWVMRVFTTILGIIETDAYLAWKLEHPNGFMSHSQFTRQLVFALLENPYRDDHRELRARRRAENDDTDSDAASDEDGDNHALAPLSRTEHFARKRARTHNVCQLHCRQCGNLAAYYCVTCSVDSEAAGARGFHALCGPGTGRPCQLQHVRDKRAE